MSKKKPSKNAKYSRNKQILKIGHYAKAIAFWSKIKIPKKHVKIHSTIHSELFSAKTACKNTKYSRNETILKISHYEKALCCHSPMGTNSAPLLADLFLHTFEYDFMVKTMKSDITKAIQFSNTFRYIDDLFSINNVDFGNYISAIYPPELQLTDTSTSSTEVCYLDTHIKTGDTTTPFRISIYDKRDDFTFRIVNFPHMDSNIPANPATVFIYLNW